MNRIEEDEIQDLGAISVETQGALGGTIDSDHHHGLGMGISDD